MSLVTAEYTRDMPVDFVVLLTFLAGCVELAMGITNLGTCIMTILLIFNSKILDNELTLTSIFTGFLVDFISIPVTSGFTSATSIIIVVSQLPGLLGLRTKSEGLVDGLKQLFMNRHKIRLNDTVLGLTCMAFLLSFRVS